MLRNTRSYESDPSRSFRYITRFWTWNATSSPQLGVGLDRPSGLVKDELRDIPMRLIVQKEGSIRTNGSGGATVIGRPGEIREIGVAVGSEGSEGFGGSGVSEEQG